MRCKSLFVFAAALIGLPVAAQQAPLTLVSWGGSYQKAQRELQWEPAGRAGGFTFREDTLSNSYAQIKLQVQARAVTWDIVQMGSFEVDQAADEGLLEEIDYKAAGIDPADYLPGMAGKYCLGTIAYSTVLAYNTDKYKANAPRNWADFWDVQRFPRPAGLQRQPGDLGAGDCVAGGRGETCGGIPVAEHAGRDRPRLRQAGATAPERRGVVGQRRAAEPGDEGQRGGHDHRLEWPHHRRHQRRGAGRDQLRWRRCAIRLLRHPEGRAQQGPCHAGAQGADGARRAGGAEQGAAVRAHQPPRLRPDRPRVGRRNCPPPPTRWPGR